MSIRWQLVLPLLATWLGVLLLSAWVGVATARGAMRRQIEAQLRNVARTLSESSFPLTPAVLAQMKGLSGADYHLVDDAGHVTTTLASAWDAPAGLPVAQSWEAVSLGPAVDLIDGRRLASGLRWRRPGDRGESTLYVLYPEASWQAAFAEALRPVLWATVLGTIASVGVILLVAERLTRRLAHVERRTSLIAKGDFQAMPITGWNDELRSLGVSINEMAESLRRMHELVRGTERFRLLGQVSGGLAHQLRNGMTGAKLAVQLHLRQCAGPHDDEALEVALRQLTLLEEKLQRFLQLGNEDECRRVPCSLTRVVDDAVALVQPQARHARIALHWRRPIDDVQVLGDAGQLGHVVVNVVSNALEAAGPDGQVDVSLKSESERCALVIQDTGPGPPPSVASRLFEPFVTSKPGGVGLGLAVASRVLDAHGGAIAWHRTDGHTQFVIHLPLASTLGHGTHPDH